MDVSAYVRRLMIAGAVAGVSEVCFTAKSCRPEHV